MTRRAGVAAGVSFGVLMLCAQSGQAPVASPSTPVVSSADTSTAALRPQPSVRIDHQLIEVPVPRPPPRPTRRPSFAKSDRSARHARRPEEALAARARRLIVGDGQYRPEPFPRLSAR
jgi:hypothetical protein